MAVQDNLTQAEIWDDRALRATWNAAEEEYNRYHSIDAKGEDVAKIFQDTAMAEHQTDQNVSSDADRDAGIIDGASTHVPAIQDADKSNGVITSAPEQSVYPLENGASTTNENAMVAETDSQSIPLLGIGMPAPSIVQSIQDKSLKDLMMSWYWAGYYTGYHEGQRQAQPGQQSNGT